jgi:zinc-ribbon domain
MFCPKCGSKNPENSAYCYNCGQKMVSPPDVSELKDIDVKKFNQELKDNTASHKNDEAALNAAMHLFFFSAVDRNGVTRFFDIKQVESGCSVGETATSAPILGECVETNYGNPGGNGRHHGHRLYGSYSTIDPHAAMQDFANFHGLTQVMEITETRNELELGATLNLIWQKLGCPATVSK